MGPPLDKESSPRGFLGLHCAAYLGCEEITVALLEMNNRDVQVIDFNGSTAIIWAVRRGHSGLARILLERSGIDPNKADTKYDRTPLSWAAESGHKKMVEKLLERNDIDHNKADAQYGRTPLTWAASGSYGGIMGRYSVGALNIDEHSSYGLPRVGVRRW